MSFIETIDPRDADETLAAMYLRQQDSWGYVPNYAKVFSHRPEVMARWAQLLSGIKRSLDKRRFELATFAAAHALRNTACSLAHAAALKPFFTDEEILAIAEGRWDGVLPEADQAMLRYAQQVAVDASAVTAGQVADLKRLGFSDAEVFDIAATAAGRAFFTKVLDALGVQADAPSRGIGETLLGPLTVGRPVDVQEPLRMPAPAIPARTAETSASMRRAAVAACR